MNIPETRIYESPMQLRDTQLVGKPYKYLEGRAVPYDTWADIGWFLEQHRHGSFKRSTNGSRSDPKIPLLLFHDNRSFPIGHAESWTHPDDGLHGVWKLNDSAEAQRAAGMADDGDLVGLSIGFQDVTRPEWEWPKDFDPDGGPEAKARVTRIESMAAICSARWTRRRSRTGFTAKPPSRVGFGQLRGSLTDPRQGCRGALARATTGDGGRVSRWRC